MEELDLRDLYYMIKKRIWLVIALFVISTVTAGLLSIYVITPKYSTDVTVMLGKFENYEGEGIDYNTIQINQKLISTYAEVAKSKSVLNEVVDLLPFETTRSYIASNLNISLQNNSEIIKISMSGTSPEEITIIANTLAEVFMTQIAERMQIDNISILDKAEIPTNPDSPNIKMNIAIAGVLGIMLSFFIIFMLEMFDHTMKVPEDVSKHLQLPVLGMIPEHE
ncbi:MAG: capsular biosynthesis protein [Clostridia bacterium]|nr:capsular biosynthesis protein [Clostridia bacterium]